MAITQGARRAVSVGAALSSARRTRPARAAQAPPVVAALSITFVRTLIVNLGVWLHFAGDADRRRRVGADCGRRCPPRSPSRCSRTSRTSRATAASASPRSPSASGRARSCRRASARSPRPLGMAVAGPAAPRGRQRGRARGRPPRPPPRCGAGRGGSTSTTRSPFTDLLPARLAALLLRVPAVSRSPSWSDDAPRSSSARPRRAGSTRSSRWATTAGSTRCSGPRRCATRPSRSRGWTTGARGRRRRRGTGFATEAIVRTVAPERVTMLDQSPRPARPRAAQARAERGGEGHGRCRGRCPSRPTR